MSDNPYVSPRSGLEQIPISRAGIRFTPGTLLFGILGLILTVLGCIVIIATIRMSRIPPGPHFGLTMIGSWLAVLGLIIIIHGFVRRQTTIIIVLAGLIVTALAIGVLTSL
jgi:hypothetical protein